MNEKGTAVGGTSSSENGDRFWCTPGEALSRSHVAVPLQGNGDHSCKRYPDLPSPDFASFCLGCVILTLCSGAGDIEISSVAFPIVPRPLDDELWTTRTVEARGTTDPPEHFLQS